MKKQTLKDIRDRLQVGSSFWIKHDVENDGDLKYYSGNHDFEIKDPTNLKEEHIEELTVAQISEKLGYKVKVIE